MESTGIAMFQPQHAPPLSPTCTHTHTHLLRVVVCHSVLRSPLELVVSLLQLDSHDMLHTEQRVVSELEGREVNIQLVDFFL